MHPRCAHARNWEHPNREPPTTKQHEAASGGPMHPRCAHARNWEHPNREPPATAQHEAASRGLEARMRSCRELGTSQQRAAPHEAASRGLKATVHVVNLYFSTNISGIGVGRCCILPIVPTDAARARIDVDKAAAGCSVAQGAI